MITQLFPVLGLNSSTTSDTLPEYAPATNSPFPEIIKVGSEQNFNEIMIFHIPSSKFDSGDNDSVDGWKFWHSEVLFCLEFTYKIDIDK